MFYRLKLKIANFIYNKAYRAIGVYSEKVNGGVHPKHEIQKYWEFFIKNVKSEDSVLDIGCGSGVILNKLAPHVKSVTGIEISDANYKKSIESISGDNIKVIHGDATNFPFEDKFDAIVMSNVLEHIDDRNTFLNCIQKIAPKILIRVPLITRSWLPVFMKNQGFEYRLDRTHYTEYTEEQIKNELKGAGIVIESEQTMWGEIYLVCRVDG